MPIIDILIAIAIVVSVAVGYVRGLIKEGLSVAALLFAIWAALYFGPVIGELADSWLESEGMQIWFGRILVFSVILSLGGLLSWGLSKIVRLSALSNLDRVAGCIFGAARGLLFVALFVLAGRYAGFSGDRWWQDSQLIPHFEVIADWVEQMAPRGLEAITPDTVSDKLPIDIPGVRN